MQYTVIINAALHVDAEDEGEAIAKAKDMTVGEGKMQSMQIMPGHQHFA